MSGDSQGLKNKYFVAFNYWSVNATYGVASTVIERELPVYGWDDILSMVDYILSRNPNMEKVVILNWQKFEGPE